MHHSKLVSSVGQVMPQGRRGIFQDHEKVVAQLNLKQIRFQQLQQDLIVHEMMRSYDRIREVPPNFNSCFRVLQHILKPSKGVQLDLMKIVSLDGWGGGGSHTWSGMTCWQSTRCFSSSAQRICRWGSRSRGSAFC